MIRNPVTLLVLTLAMLLAPLGVCIGRGHVQPATASSHHSAGMHGGVRHSGHEGSGKLQFCGDCQPPDFVTAAKADADTGPQLAPAPAIMPAVVQFPAGRDSAPAHQWYGRAPPIPPPLPSATKVRLQI